MSKKETLEVAVFLCRFKLLEGVAIYPVLVTKMIFILWYISKKFSEAIGHIVNIRVRISMSGYTLLNEMNATVTVNQRVHNMSGV